MVLYVSTLLIVFLCLGIYLKPNILVDPLVGPLRDAFHLIELFCFLFLFHGFLYKCIALLGVIDCLYDRICPLVGPLRDAFHLACIAFLWFLLNTYISLCIAYVYMFVIAIFIMLVLGVFLCGRSLFGMHGRSTAGCLPPQSALFYHYH